MTGFSSEWALIFVRSFFAAGNRELDSHRDIERGREGMTNRLTNQEREREESEFGDERGLGRWGMAERMGGGGGMQGEDGK